MQINFYGNQISLLTDAAIVLVKHKALILSDVHLGKAGIFQKFGIPIPTGHSVADLNKIRQLVIQYQIDMLIIVGDLIHGKINNQFLKKQLVQLFTAMQLKRYILIKGNHDTFLLDNDLFEVIHSFQLGNLLFTHEPLKQPTTPNICGHVHPVINLQHDKLRYRLKCFYHKKNQLILPAFGEFTGGFNINLRPKETAYLIGPNKVSEYKKNN